MKNENAVLAEGHVITFYVDNEPVQTRDQTLTVGAILEMSGNTPIEDYYLIEFHGQHGQQVRHDDLSEVIHIHPEQRFAAVFRGPTPVS